MIILCDQLKSQVDKYKLKYVIFVFICEIF